MKLFIKNTALFVALLVVAAPICAMEKGKEAQTWGQYMWSWVPFTGTTKTQDTQPKLPIKIEGNTPAEKRASMKKLMKADEKSVASIVHDFRRVKDAKANLLKVQGPRNEKGDLPLNPRDMQLYKSIVDVQEPVYNEVLADKPWHKKALSAAFLKFKFDEQSTAKKALIIGGAATAVAATVAGVSYLVYKAFFAKDAFKKHTSTLKSMANEITKAYDENANVKFEALVTKCLPKLTLLSEETKAEMTEGAKAIDTAREVAAKGDAFMSAQEKKKAAEDTAKMVKDFTAFMTEKCVQEAEQAAANTQEKKSEGFFGKIRNFFGSSEDESTEEATA